MSYNSELPEEAGMVKCFGGMVIDDHLPCDESDTQIAASVQHSQYDLGGYNIEGQNSFVQEAETECGYERSGSCFMPESKASIDGQCSENTAPQVSVLVRKQALSPKNTTEIVHARRCDVASVLSYAALAADDTSGNNNCPTGRPLFLSSVAAGFPSPADDYMDKRLDLNEHLIRNPESTFFVRVHGESMRDAGIFPDDILIVDRAVQPASGRVVIAVLDGELTVKRLKKHGDALWLMPENAEYSPVNVTGREDFSVWGVVTCVLHKV